MRSARAIFAMLACCGAAAAHAASLNATASFLSLEASPRSAALAGLSAAGSDVLAVVSNHANLGDRQALPAVSLAGHRVAGADTFVGAAAGFGTKWADLGAYVTSIGTAPFDRMDAFFALQTESLAYRGTAAGLVAARMLGPVRAGLTAKYVGESYGAARATRG
ncbi:MAG: hypothetical protein AAB368_10225, partial [bacterium]